MLFALEVGVSCLVDLMKTEDTVIVVNEKRCEFYRKYGVNPIDEELCYDERGNPVIVHKYRKKEIEKLNDVYKEWCSLRVLR